MTKQPSKRRKLFLMALFLSGCAKPAPKMECRVGDKYIIDAHYVHSGYLFYHVEAQMFECKPSSYWEAVQ